MKYPYLTLALLVFFGVADLIILGNHFELTKSDWSGWVQAIGSIAALAVAIFVMSRQNSAAAKLVDETDLRALQRRAKAVSALVDRAHLQLSACINELNQNARHGTQQSLNSACLAGATVLRQMRAALEQIPPYELGSYGMVDGLHQTIGAISIFERTAEAWLADTRMSKPSHEMLSIIPALCEPAETSYSAFRAGLAELGIR